MNWAVDENVSNATKCIILLFKNYQCQLYYCNFNLFFLSSLKKKQAKNESPLKEISNAHDGSGEWFPVPEVTSYKHADDPL